MALLTSDRPLPAISIVIPAHNASDTIESTLASALGQTYPADRLEIVVVDDGSTDGTLAEARRVLSEGDVSYIVLHNDVAQGPSAARNQGWRRSRGEWIQFLDADDLIERSKIGVQAKVALAEPPDTAAVFSPWGRLAVVNGRWQPQTPWLSPSVGSDAVLDLLRAENFMQLGSLLFSRRWLERAGGFTEEHWLIEDVDLLLRLVMDGGALRPAESREPLAWYRQRQGSLSRTDERAFFLGCVRNARLAERHWADRRELTAERASVISEILFMAARYFAEHDRAEFAALARDIYRLNPRFVPQSPRGLRLLTRLVGYARAERCAVRYRHAKRVLGRSPNAAFPSAPVISKP